MFVDCLCKLLRQARRAPWNSSVRKTPRPPCSFRPRTECLEDRFAPAMLTLTAVNDNTLYQDPSGNLSNGAGQHFFVGDTGQLTNNIRRGLIKFNLSGIPAGST